MIRGRGARKTGGKFVAVVAVAGFVLTASGAVATPMTFSDTVDPDPDQLVSFGSRQSYSFTHSVNADQDPSGTNWTGTYGYDPLTDTITAASVLLTFMDESTDAASESVSLTFDGRSFGTAIITSGGAASTVTVTAGFGTLLNDGILNVTLQNAGTTSGPQDARSDFVFVSSTLTVRAERQAAALAAIAVPEPATPALMGLGFACVALARRRRAD